MILLFSFLWFFAAKVFKSLRKILGFKICWPASYSVMRNFLFINLPVMAELTPASNSPGQFYYKNSLSNHKKICLLDRPCYIQRIDQIGLYWKITWLSLYNLTCFLRLYWIGLDQSHKRHRIYLPKHLQSIKNYTPLFKTPLRYFRCGHSLPRSHRFASW